MFKKLLHALLIGLGAGVFSLVLWRLGALDSIEGAIWAHRVQLLARPSAVTPAIKIIAVDQQSLEWMLEQDQSLTWPWPRQVYAPILSFLKRGQAKVVAFDMIFEHPSAKGVEDDRMFAQAIAEGPRFVSTVTLSSENGVDAWPTQASQKSLPLGGYEAWRLAGGADLSYPHARFPVPAIADQAALFGNVTETPDADAIVRRVHLVRVFAGRAAPSLALAALLAAESAPLAIAPGCLQVGTRRVPIDAHGASTLHFRGPKGTHEKISAAAVIQSELRILEGETPTLDPERFRDTYVFLIPTAAATHDFWATPVDDTYPGGEIHATALDNLLTGDFLRETPDWLVIVSTLFLAVVSAGVAFRPAKTWLTVAAFLAILLPYGIGLAAYEEGLWWPEVAQSIAVLVAVAGVLVLKYATEGRERRFIKQAFQHYLSPAVIERVLADPSRLALGGERRELSIFFSDLQGFTSLSEKLDPQDLTALLNDYLSDMTDIILDEGGTLDKYEGDAIIAFWNAPLDQADHALRAVRAALRMQRKLAERREEFRARTGETLRMRIGLHTGVVVVGNMGSRRRFDYTVLGDAANLASRLEGANKALGTYTMVSEATWTKAVPGIVGRELGQLRVVGRKEPVRVFEPLGLETEAVDMTDATRFTDALAACRAGRWAEAKALFENLPEDAAAQTYATRCSELHAATGGEWDTVWNLTSK